MAKRSKSRSERAAVREHEVGSIAAGAAGAAVGSLLGPVGAAIGAAIGAATGGLSGSFSKPGKRGIDNASDSKNSRRRQERGGKTSPKSRASASGRADRTPKSRRRSATDKSAKAGAGR